MTLAKRSVRLMDMRNKGFRVLVLFLTNMHVPLLSALVASYDCVDSEKGRVLDKEGPRREVLKTPEEVAEALVLSVCGQDKCSYLPCGWDSVDQVFCQH